MMTLNPKPFLSGFFVLKKVTTVYSVELFRRIMNDSLILFEKVIDMDISIARGYCMALMIIIQNIHAFNCRSEKKSIFKMSLKSNKIFLIGVLGSLILGIAVIEIDFLNVFLKTNHIPYNHLLILLGIGFIIMIVMEIYKKIKYNNK